VLNSGMLIALGKEHELKLHLNGALNNGLTKDEIRKSCCRPRSTAACPPPWWRSAAPGKYQGPQGVRTVASSGSVAWATMAANLAKEGFAVRSST